MLSFSSDRGELGRTDWPTSSVHHIGHRVGLTLLLIRKVIAIA